MFLSDLFVVRLLINPILSFVYHLLSFICLFLLFNCFQMIDFNSEDIQLWKSHLESYEESVSLVAKKDFPELDYFWRTILPQNIQSRKEPYVTKDELVKLMQWKLSRGKWRPRLLNFIKDLSEKDVKSSSTKAFQSLPDLKNAISELTVLKGVGPATASAVLACHSPSLVPFMSDEAMECAMEEGLKITYTLKHYLSFAEKLKQKAEELSELGDEIFHAFDIEIAIWSSHMKDSAPIKKGKLRKEDAQDGSRRKKLKN